MVQKKKRKESLIDLLSSNSVSMILHSLLGQSRPHGRCQNIIARDRLIPATTISFRVVPWSLLMLLLFWCSKRSEFYRPEKGVL